MDKKEILRHPLTLLLGFFILVFLYSRFGPSLPLKVLTQQRGEPLVVTGEGRLTVVPDIAKVFLGIEEAGVSLKAVQDSVDKKSKNLVDELKKLGISDKDIKTTSYNIFPEQDFESGSPRIVGFRVSTSYEVKIRDFDQVNQALVAATGAGANLVGGLAFEVNEETKAKKLDEARSLAVRQAKEKAESLARAAGVRLGEIISISSSDQLPPPLPIPLRQAGGELEFPERPEILPGEEELMVQVTISFEIR